MLARLGASASLCPFTGSRDSHVKWIIVPLISRINWLCRERYLIEIYRQSGRLRNKPGAPRPTANWPVTGGASAHPPRPSHSDGRLHGSPCFMVPPSGHLQAHVIGMVSCVRVRRASGHTRGDRAGRAEAVLSEQTGSELTFRTPAWASWS